MEIIRRSRRFSLDLSYCASVPSVRQEKQVLVMSGARSISGAMTSWLRFRSTFSIASLCYSSTSTARSRWCRPSAANVGAYTESRHCRNVARFDCSAGSRAATRQKAASTNGAAVTGNLEHGLLSERLPQATERRQGVRTRLL